MKDLHGFGLCGLCGLSGRTKVIAQTLFMKIRDRYRDNIPVYTDGSRDRNYVACATVFPSDTVMSMRLPDTAEVLAIIKALD